MTERLERADATVVYDQRGGSGVPLVFIHGWACRRRDWDGVVAHLQGRPVMLVDLPWHGESTSARPLWTTADYGMVVADLVRQTGMERVVLVGHSMGGAVALEAARLLDTVVDRVVGLDSLTYAGFYPRQPPDVIQSAVAPFEADFPAAIRALVEAFSGDGADRALIDAVAAEMASTPEQPAVLALRALLEWDLDMALTKVRAPITVFAARQYLVRDVVDQYGQRFEIVPVDLGGHFFLRQDPAGTARLLQERSS
ncbi:MAG: alpha/beta hydrolase [Chloroflexi bacterium]|nr:alpha/beta hydrolase [Chloroflexota bacterium]